MRVVDWDSLERGEARADRWVALTIGVFDGLHIGHQKLIQAIRSAGPEILPVVLTFTRNPASVLNDPGPTGRAPPGRILSFAQKLAKLERLGVGWVVLIDFSREFSKLTGRVFLEKLNTFFQIRKIVVGYSFFFGRNRDSDVYALKRMLEGSGAGVEVVEPTLYQDEVVSSSRIRREIAAGRLSQVRSMLGEEYSLDLSGVPAKREKDGWIEVPRSEISQILPPEGDYGVLLATDRGTVPGKAIVTDQAIRWTAEPDVETKRLAFADHVETRRT